MNEINPSSVQQIQLRTLRDVEIYLKNLKKDIQLGKISTQDIDFVPIFHSIQEIVNNKNLKTIVTEFKSSSDLFGKKIQDIQAYISAIGGEEDFESIIKVESQNSLHECFQALYKPPFIIEDINLNTLYDSFVKLTNKKKIWESVEFPDFSEIAKEEFNMGEIDFLIDDVHFERELNSFELKLLPTLPQKLSDIIDTTTNTEIRYKRFVFCLYLIQRKKVVFIKNTNRLEEYKDEKNE
ncbi:MAG: hypothetical protein JW776_14970 [Candidatus Lokiarchaeota archaeon]|nr:hypothetical protein [Candidatus Lokiarchaeota archaeon]